MKTRYKTSLVIASFVAFYFALIPATHMCLESDSDCTIYQELIILTRPVVTLNIWDAGDGTGTWSGTVEDMKEPTLIDSLGSNMKFVLSMVILPISIIAGIVFWDKRK